MFITVYVDIERESKMQHVILDSKLRDLWYHSHTHTGRKGYYAYGSKDLRCIKTPKGYRCRGKHLPLDTPIYRYGYNTSPFLTVPHGPFVYKCQIPGVDLMHPSSIEEEIFPYTSLFLRRSGKHRLKVRCGKYYRVILLKHNVTTPFCYVFGTNIRLPTHKVPEWLRRKSIVFPHPRKTSKKIIRSKFGKCYAMGSPVIGLVSIVGIQMKCTKIGQLCVIYYGGQRYYAHASVVFKWTP